MIETSSNLYYFNLESVCAVQDVPFIQILINWSTQQMF